MGNRLVTRASGLAGIEYKLIWGLKNKDSWFLKGEGLGSGTWLGEETLAREGIL